MSLTVVLSFAVLCATLLALLAALFFAHRRQESLRRQADLALGLSARLLSAPDEETVLRSALASGCELLGAHGGAFVPFDEVRHRLPAVAHGEVPQGEADVWLARLALPAVRQTCKLCERREAGVECVLLENAQGATRVACAVIRFGGREQGVFNFFLAKPRRLNVDEHALVNGLALAVDHALASLRDQDEELMALRFLQSARARRDDLPASLQSLLEQLHQALEIEFALLWVPDADGSEGAIWLQDAWPRDGTPARLDPDAVRDVWREVLGARQPVIHVDADLAGVRWGVFLALPLSWGDALPIGLLALGSREARQFNPRQIILLRALAGQAALLARDQRLLGRVEYQAVADERNRLAREIHDGLAQTLAFLKIETARMQSYLAAGQTEPLTRALQGAHRTLDDAYLDARQAINDLRRVPESCLRTWLMQTGADFRAATGLTVSLEVDDPIPALEPGARAQIARIVQEALNNARKHSGASAVTLGARVREDALLIEVRDNGRGFTPGQVRPEAQHGLRGMRERAEGLGADFQVESIPGRGTAVRVRIPLGSGSEEGE